MKGSNMPEGEKWVKKLISTGKRRFKDESYVKRKFLIEVSCHFAAPSGTYFMDYIEYRLNLDHGTDGLIILEDIKLLEGDTHEISNET